MAIKKTVEAINAKHHTNSIIDLEECLTFPQNAVTLPRTLLTRFYFREGMYCNAIMFYPEGNGTLIRSSDGCMIVDYFVEDLKVPFITSAPISSLREYLRGIKDKDVTFTVEEGRLNVFGEGYKITFKHRYDATLPKFEQIIPNDYMMPNVATVKVADLKKAMDAFIKEKRKEGIARGLLTLKEGAQTFTFDIGGWGSHVALLSAKGSICIALDAVRIKKVLGFATDKEVTLRFTDSDRKMIKVVSGKGTAYIMPML